MRTNMMRVAVGICFFIAVVGAYLLGKGSGKREVETIAAKSAGVRSDTPMLRDGQGRAVAGGGVAETNPDGSPVAQPSVKSIIAKARLKMQGGMMDMNGVMRALVMLDGISDDQIQEALAEVERSIKEPQQKMMFAMLLLSRWAEKDGRAALAYAEEHFDTKNPMMMGLKSGVITSWAKSDPDAAWEWFREQDPDEIGGGFGLSSRSMALVGIIGSLAMKDPDLAFDRLGKIEDDQERMMALQGLGQAIWDEGRRDAILARIEGMENEGEKVAARQAVLGQWTQMDPDGAVAWAETLAGDDRKQAIQQIGRSLTWMDPERSGDLMLSVAETSQERQQAYSSAISMWANNDPNAAGEWLGRQDQGSDLDQARQQFANSVVQKDPVSAMAWADAVTDDQMRASAVQQVYMQWAGKDKEAADAALSETRLSEEKIEEFQSMEVGAGSTRTAIYEHPAGFIVEEEVPVEAAEAVMEEE